MSYTALHRAAGAERGQLTEEILQGAVDAEATESDDLDWKRKLPSAADLKKSDFPKDVAAMANSGGGIIVYGVAEEKKAATERVDAGECDETFERSLRDVARVAITPPVFALGVHRLGVKPLRALAVEVPASIDGPHLIYRNEFFGAPMRNDADTVWMKERQLEAMYRARFDERRHAAEALDSLYFEASAGLKESDRAWLLAVAYPRVPRPLKRLTRDEARWVLECSTRVVVKYARSDGVHPLENMDRLNPRPGLRRWVARDATTEGTRWKAAWASIHHDGSVILAAAVGGHRSGSNTFRDATQVESAAIEAAVADHMALLRSTAESTNSDEFDVRVGIHWAKEKPLSILASDAGGRAYDYGSAPLLHYTPVDTSVNARDSQEVFHEHVYLLARDCINQGGVTDTVVVNLPYAGET